MVKKETTITVMEAEGLGTKVDLIVKILLLKKTVMGKDEEKTVKKVLDKGVTASAEMELT